MRHATHRCPLLCSLAAAVAMTVPWQAWAAPASQPKRPNIIFILADDLGWMDTTINGSRYYQTPNLERLARQGMRLSNACTASPLCSPTRASILTGLYPHRLAITWPLGHEDPTPQDGKNAPHGPPYAITTNFISAKYLPLEEMTVAEALKASGYDTIFLGKWHLGKDEKYWPDRQGFDVNLGGRGDHGPPGGYFRTRTNTLLPKAPDGTHYNDLLTDLVVDYLGSREDAADPFFMCLWYYDVHGPWEGKPELVEKYRALRDPRGKQDCAVMGAMIETLDAGVGRVLDALDRTGLADDTLVIFFSDNGGTMYQEVDGTIPTDNAPLRGGKGVLREGGTRVPMVVRWPGKVAPGSVCDEPVCSIDFYPTLLAAAGAEPPPGKVLDGKDLTPLLTGTVQPLPPRSLFWHYPHWQHSTRTDVGPAAAVRRGDWKLYRFFFAGPDFTDRLELYNLADDIGEHDDLAAKRPDLAAELNASLSEWLTETNAILPQRNPKYDPQATGSWRKVLRAELWGDRRYE